MRSVTCVSSDLGHTFLERWMRVSKFQLSRKLFKTRQSLLGISREERQKAHGKCHKRQPVLVFIGEMKLLRLPLGKRNGSLGWQGAAGTTGIAGTYRDLP